MFTFSLALEKEHIKKAAWGTKLKWHGIKREYGNFSYSCLYPPMYSYIYA